MGFQFRVSIGPVVDAGERASSFGGPPIAATPARSVTGPRTGGTDAVIYMVTGQRSGVQSGTAEVNVRFGTVGGNVTASIFNTPGGAKMAA